MRTIRCANCSDSREIKSDLTWNQTAWFVIRNGWIRMFDWNARRELYFCCGECERKFKEQSVSKVYDLLMKTKRTN